MKIAVLGLGIMGSGMALRLVKSGFDVTVWNRSPGRAEPLAAAGAKVAATPAEAATGADLVLSMLADDTAARATWLGDHGAATALKSGAICVESSTVSLSWIKEWSQAVTARGAQPLDAPVTGSKAAAENGELVFIAGGEASTLEAARPALAAMSKGVVHLGPIGSGAALKLINNFMCGVQLASLAEALTMIDRAGLDRAQAAEILANGSPGSPFVKLVGGRMVGGDATINFLLRLMAKDMTYAKAEGEALGIDMQTATGALAQISRGVDHGFGDHDISSLYEALKNDT